MIGLLLAGATLALHSARAQTPVGSAPASDSDAAMEATVKEACSQCHAWPSPTILPKRVWPDRIEEMGENSLLGLGLGGEMGNLWKYNLHEIKQFYTSRAPEELAPPDPWPDPAEAPLRFRRHALRPSEGAPAPAISNVRFLDMDGDAHPELIATDMREGLIYYARPTESLRLEIIGRVPHPARTAPVDLDGDGLLDLIVPDLGEFLPGDHLKGSIAWLRQQGPGAYETATLFTGLARMADVEAADFDGDGDIDLVTAGFGWRKYGSIDFYEATSAQPAADSYEVWPVDARAGGIHVPIVDLDGDGRLDFVALLSQQHERVVAFINLGPGRGFRPRNLFAGPHPAWGASGIEMVDLDMDGDLDVLLTNGDTLDDHIVKPFHGISWLENQGDYPFVHHPLAQMPGVHRAQAADMDGDGDLDIVATALLMDLDDARADFASLVLLEQVTPGMFERHTLKKGELAHATLDLGDYDLDGDVDIALGVFSGIFFFEGSARPFDGEVWVEIWENLGAAQGPAASAASSPERASSPR